MTRDLSDVIARLSATIAAGDKHPHVRHAAAITGGVPVYADMGGTMILARDGTIVEMEHDRDDVRRETDERWRLIALARAARMYPELAELFPRRPSGALPCDECAGTGRIAVLDADCFQCSTLGWITTSRGPLDDLIDLDPTAVELRWDLAAVLRKLSPPELISMGVDIVEDRAAALCALYVHLRPTKSTHVRSIPENGLFTIVALWLQILGPRFRAVRVWADLDSAVQLLTDIWKAIAEKAEQPIEEAFSLLIAGHIVSVGIRAAHERRPLLATVDPQLVGRYPVFESLRHCENLGELVREARSQLGIAATT